VDILLDIQALVWGEVRRQRVRRNMVHRNTEHLECRAVKVLPQRSMRTETMQLKSRELAEVKRSSLSVLTS
jgi:hypothetical protein